MAKRVESPSSINTFKQCKRKYYYQYIEKLPTSGSIHTVRGNIAHSCLEDFYDISTQHWDDKNYTIECKKAIQKLLLHHWQGYGEKLQELNLSPDQMKFYFEETMVMLMNWTNQFTKQLQETIKNKNHSIQEAFEYIKPIRELQYRSDNYSVRGFIDAIHQVEEEIHLLDYKTNSRFDMKDSIKLQLAIYSLLYFEKHGKKPSKVGIFFLRHKKKMIKVDEELLQLARREVELIHAHTSITEDKHDYPQTITGLCKWKSGQCDFFSTCTPDLSKKRNGRRY